MSHRALERSFRLRPFRMALLVMVAALGSAALAPAPVHAGDKVYRWIDEKGVVHYGDRVPPQYSQDETTVLNRHGVIVDHVGAPMSPAELAQAARAQAKEVAEKQRDNFLLTTYTSEKDIEQLRDERLEQMKGQRAAAEQYIASLHERLLALEARAMLFKPYNPEPRSHRMPDDLAEQIVRTHDEERTQVTALAARDQEETAMRAQFQADIDRYRELHAAAVPGSR